jgi:membrane protein
MPSDAQARGRDAVKPADLPRAGWKDVLLRVGSRIGEDHVSVMAGGIAFFALLALVPALGAFISVAGLIFEPGSVTAQISRMEGLLPPPALEILRNQVGSIGSGAESGLGFAALGSLLITLFSASRGVNTLIEGINLAHGEEESRNFFIRNATAFGLTLLLIALALVAMGAILVTPAVLAIFGASAMLETLVSLGSFVLLAGVFMASLGLIYRYAPARRQPKWGWVTPGAILATVLWLASSAAFSIYVSNFGSYNQTYGALGGVVILLLWLWLSCFVVLLGAQVNAELEHQTRHDTTRGPDRPMGQRGAYMADTLGDTSN